MKRKSFIWLGLGVVLLLLMELDVCCGSIWLTPFGNWSPIEEQIVWNWRLPRIITAVLAGASLSVAGLMMQTLFRNPLAGPYILGVSSGASLGVALLTMCASLVGGTLWSGGLSMMAAALIGSGVVLMLVMTIAKRVHSNVSLLIVGLMIGSLAGALVNLIQNFANPDALKLFIVWTLGSLQSVGWSEMPILMAVIAVGLAMSVYLIKPLDGLRMGEDYARGLGVRVERTRALIVLSTSLLAGGITAFCGPIAFVGVAVPHIARGLFATSNHRVILPASALIGANMLLVCDILCSLFTYPLPISTVSALFGAPIIIYIILRR